LKLAVYQPDIAPNLGAIIRICACFGVPLDVIEPCGFPLSSKTLKRAAMDYGNQASVSHHDSWQSFRRAAGPARLILLTTSASDTIWNFAFAPGDTLIMGRESAGVPGDVAACCDARVKIPMPGGGRSLNVAVSAGIVLAEALRQLNANHQGAKPSGRAIIRAP